MFVVRHLLSVVVCHLALFDVCRCFLFVLCRCFLFVVCYLSFVICHCWSLFVVVLLGFHRIFFSLALKIKENPLIVYSLSSTPNACRK